MILRNCHYFFSALKVEVDRTFEERLLHCFGKINDDSFVIMQIICIIRHNRVVIKSLGWAVRLPGFFNLPLLTV